LDSNTSPGTDVSHAETNDVDRLFREHNAALLHFFGDAAATGGLISLRAAAPRVHNRGWSATETLARRGSPLNRVE
jgi:hypothetical protein